MKAPEVAGTMDLLFKVPPRARSPASSDVLERPYTVGGGGVPPLTLPYLPPLGPPPSLLLL